MRRIGCVIIIAFMIALKVYEEFAGKLPPIRNRLREERQQALYGRYGDTSVMWAAKEKKKKVLY